MNWGWPSNSKSVLTDNASKAENRLKAIKQVSPFCNRVVIDPKFFHLCFPFSGYQNF